MSILRRVAITGLGAITPLGNSTECFFAALMKGKSGIAGLQADFAAQLEHPVVAQCQFDPDQYFDRSRVAKLDRVSQFTLVAARQAVSDAGLELTNSDKSGMGVCLGTSMAGSCTIDASYNRLYKEKTQRLEPFTVLMAMSNAAASQIALEFGLQGPNLTYSTACASSAVAIGEAARKIRYGEARVMLAGGAEASLTFGTLKAWQALRILAKEDSNDVSTSCKPFADDRTGLVLGEGAAMLVLEDWQHAKARGARIYAELAGYGLSNDSGHIIQPSADRQAAAMQAALDDAGLPATAISYINAHGTATRLNDVTETQAIKQVFADSAGTIPISSTKSMHGHLLGATAAVELIASVKALQHGCIPPTANLLNPDPELELDYVANVGRHGVSLEHVMSNSFAFGGTSGVLVISRSASV